MSEPDTLPVPIQEYYYREKLIERAVELLRDVEEHAIDWSPGGRSAAWHDKVGEWLRDAGMEK